MFLTQTEIHVSLLEIGVQEAPGLQELTASTKDCSLAGQIPRVGNLASCFK